MKKEEVKTPLIILTGPTAAGKGTGTNVVRAKEWLAPFF